MHRGSAALCHLVGELGSNVLLSSYIILQICAATFLWEGMSLGLSYGRAHAVCQRALLILAAYQSPCQSVRKVRAILDGGHRAMLVVRICYKTSTKKPALWIRMPDEAYAVKVHPFRLLGC